MEAILNLKGSDEKTTTTCIICDKVESKSNNFSTGTQKAILSLQKAASLIMLKYNPEHRSAINRIQTIETSSVSYHPSCYATFTSKKMINKLPDINKNLKTVSNNNVETTHQTNSNPTIWTACILCQDESKKEHQRKISSESIQQKIRQLADTDPILARRIGGTSTDLIAKKAYYHTNCLNTSERNSEKNVNDRSSAPGCANLALKELCSELYVAADKGEVFQLRTVFARYTNLAKKFNENVPQSFISRLSTFKEKLVELVGDIYQFYQPLNVDVESRQMLLIPIKYQFSLISEAVNDVLNGVTEPIGSTTSNDNTFINDVHTALKIHGDMDAMSGHKGLDVSLDAAKKIVPESLLNFLCILTRGQSSLDEILESEFCENEYDEDEDACNEGEIGTSYQDRKSNYEKKILSIAQDIIYVASKGKKLTPKHIGLGMSLHQMTRSRKLVTLFSRAGHCISYPKVLQVDNTLADLTLTTLDYSTGAVVPPNFQSAAKIQENESHLVPAPILQMTADNIDIITDNLDGKKSFHGTQIVAFQRGPPKSTSTLDQVEIKKKASFRIPHILNQLPPDPTLPQFSPKFEEPINPNWYERNADVPESWKHAKATDLSFLVTRHNESEDDNYVGWTEFNQRISRKTAEVTVQGYLPLILNPAHEHTTLSLFLKRAISLADNLNYRYVVVTVDQALHLKLLELKMANPIYQKRIIVKMGGLHLSMNYLKAIGQHMSETGLSEIWRESGILADGSILKVNDGKAYAKAMRAHKLTFQAMWRILMPRLLSFIQGKSVELHTILSQENQNLDSLVTVLKAEKFSFLLSEFVEHESSQNNNFKFWWTYVDSINTLLLFTRSIRDAEWGIYLHALKNMLPLMERYNHRNYLQSLTIYIAEMHQLPIEVKLAFESGDFVVKATEGKFNQVDADHAQEWLVGVSKDCGGIVGTTHNDNTLQRWALSFGWRTEITKKTFEMYGFTTVHGITKEATAARRKRDNRDELSILQVLTHFNVFAQVTYSGIMQNIVTKDVATDDIQQFLLNVAEDGENQVLSFVKERLIGDENGVRINFNDPIKQNFVASMKKLYEVPRKQNANQSNQKVLKAHGNILQRLIMAFEAGREMNLEKMLERELHQYPLSLVDANGQLRSGNQLDVSVFLKPADCATDLSYLSKEQAHLIVTGQNILQEIPKNLKRFGDLSNSCAEYIERLSHTFSRIDIVFGRLKGNSLTTGKPLQKLKKPIRRIIENGDVALPKPWNAFLEHPQNEEDLYRFLTLEISKECFDGTDLLLAGGCLEEKKVVCSNPNMCTENLMCSQVQLPTRIIRHVMNSEHKILVIYAEGVDILALLIHYFDKMKCDELWLKAGTNKKRIYIPIHTVCSNLSSLVKQNILAFDAITGSSLTSFIAGITKNTGWNVYLENAILLSDLDKNPLSENAIRSAEEFVVKLYKLGQVAKTTNTARYILFGAVKAPEFLPPTTDAIEQHIKRSHYQAWTWKHAHETQTQEISPLSFGWQLNEAGEFLPILLTYDPVNKDCIEFTTCGCLTQCDNRRCGCVKANMGCTVMCTCVGCKNPNNKKQ